MKVQIHIIEPILPEFCYAIDPVLKEVVLIHRNKSISFLCAPCGESKCKLVDALNRKMGVTALQEALILAEVYGEDEEFGEDEEE